MSFCRNNTAAGKFKLAVGSFIEEYCNEIHIIQLSQNERTGGVFKKLTKLDHPYPPTKVCV